MVCQPCPVAVDTKPADSTTAADSTAAPNALEESPPTPKPATPTLSQPNRSVPAHRRRTMLPRQSQHPRRPARRLSRHPLRHPRLERKLRASQPQRNSHLDAQRQRRTQSLMVPRFRPGRSHHRRAGPGHRPQPQTNPQGRRHPNRKAPPACAQAQESSADPPQHHRRKPHPQSTAPLNTQPHPVAPTEDPFCRLLAQHAPITIANPPKTGPIGPKTA